MKHRITITGIALLVMALWSCTALNSSDYRALIAKGEFTKAQEEMTRLLAEDKTLSETERLELAFEIERLERVRKDFRQTEEEVLVYIREVIPDADQADLRRWEASQALEHKVIDGRTWYFNVAGRNLFRVDREAKEAWIAAHAGEKQTVGSGAAFVLNDHNRAVINEAVASGRRYVQPVRLRITQGVVVDADAVPAGEVLRCWIPFPREIDGRQENIHLRSTEPAQHILADPAHLQRTIYFEKMAQAGEPTQFEVSYEYTAHGVYAPVNPDEVKPAEITAELAPYVSEEPPHIVFTPAMRELSEEVVGDETNPYLIARKLFAWMDANRPWASAREYSSIPNISDYCLTSGHGDCGILTLMFVTLLRLNGIPAKWQSGWEFQPPRDSMHDWGMVYYEPTGWVPMDVDYGLRRTEDEPLKWFYLSGMDSYRLVFNDAYSQPFYPAKAHFRSETVDSQRGEVEWRGGNLYFDQWDWEFDWEEVE
jgi:transglutaminase-like putative cysteine protease